MISHTFYAALLAACCIAQPEAPGSYYSQAQSRIRVSAHLDFQFTDVPLLERYEVAAKLGFKLVELTPYDVRPEQLRAAANKFGLQHVMINAPLGNFSAGERGLAALPSQVQRFRESIETAIHYAKVLGAKQVNVLAGIVDFNSSLAKTTYLENIKYTSRRFAQEGLQILVEPIRGSDIVGYFLQNLNQADLIFAALKLTNSGVNNLAVLFDVWQICGTEEHICGHGEREKFAPIIKKWQRRIGHFHVAQVPNRHEPDSTGLLDYGSIFSVLNAANPSWIAGCEYKTSGDTKVFLKWIQKYGLSF